MCVFCNHLTQTKYANDSDQLRYVVMQVTVRSGAEERSGLKRSLQVFLFFKI